MRLDSVRLQSPAPICASRLRVPPTFSLRLPRDQAEAKLSGQLALPRPLLSRMSCGPRMRRFASLAHACMPVALLRWPLGAVHLVCPSRDAEVMGAPLHACALTGSARTWCQAARSSDHRHAWPLALAAKPSVRKLLDAKDPLYKFPSAEEEVGKRCLLLASAASSNLRSRRACRGDNGSWCREGAQRRLANSRTCKPENVLLCSSPSQVELNAYCKTASCRYMWRKVTFLGSHQMPSLRASPSFPHGCRLESPASASTAC